MRLRPGAGGIEPCKKCLQHNGFSTPLWPVDSAFDSNQTRDGLQKSDASNRIRIMSLYGTGFEVFVKVSTVSAARVPI
jgi:hypothetical protein